jgi:hypothetical protein
MFSDLHSFKLSRSVTMSDAKRILGNAIGLGIAVLYTLAGQAHLTNKFTPGLAANIEEMTPRSHQAFWFLNLSYPHVSVIKTAPGLVANKSMYSLNSFSACSI